MALDQAFIQQSISGEVGGSHSQDHVTKEYTDSVTAIQLSVQNLLSFVET